MPRSLELAEKGDLEIVEGKKRKLVGGTVGRDQDARFFDPYHVLPFAASVNNLDLEKVVDILARGKKVPYPS